MQVQKKLGMFACALMLAACGGGGDSGGNATTAQGGNGSGDNRGSGNTVDNGGSGATNGGTDQQTSTVSGVVLSRDEAEMPVEGVTVGVYGTSISATTDADGQFTLKGVPNGDVFFTTEANGYWGVVDYYGVPSETSGGIDLGVLPDGQIALVEQALDRTIDSGQSGVDINFYEGAQGGEGGSISASSDDPFTFDVDGVPVEQDTIIADGGIGDLVFSSVKTSAGPISATVTGASGDTDCYVDETPGIKYPLLEKSISIVYAWCEPAR